MSLEIEFDLRSCALQHVGHAVDNDVEKRHEHHVRAGRDGLCRVRSARRKS